MKSPLPVPEFIDDDDCSFTFKKANRQRVASHLRRPPKLFHQSFSRCVHASTANVISFREDSQSELSALYNRGKAESYYEQCFDQLAKVGEGSFGEVFKVRSRTDGQLYAVKKSIALFRSERCRQACFEEVRRYEQFSDHENCVKLYQAWEQDERLYMQMELCKSSLESVAMGELPESRIWSILLDLLLALKSLHDRNLIHLDIKLANILVTDDGTCKLADFGLVFDLTQGNSRYASEGDSRYIAPELMEGRYTKAADIFSLGLATLELACNLELPKDGRMWHRLRSTQPLPDELMKKMSPALRDIVQRMLRVQPEERPTVDALLHHPTVQKLREDRNRSRLVRGIVGFFRRKMLTLRQFIAGALVWLVACFRLQHRKRPSERDSRRSSKRASRSFQEQSSGALHGDSFYDKAEDEDGDGVAESPGSKDSMQSTPTLNNSVPSHPPSIRIVNSTPLNHHHLHQMQNSLLQQLHQQQHQSGNGLRYHQNRLPCSPLRVLWFGEDDDDDLSLLNDSQSHNRHAISSTPLHGRKAGSAAQLNKTAEKLKHLNDSDNDIRPLSTSLPKEEQGQSPTSSGSGKAVGGAGEGNTSDHDSSIMATPNCSLHLLHSGARGFAATPPSGCDSLSSGFASFPSKKRLHFNLDEDDTDSN
ncbi:membrane-associated tyrosine- and threonine-specific cdc2-inhibitory kinase-like [Anopheles albimanus]|uniref:Membrane-associated tyrosine- and threonine-specific cdc2-inhibitory kinase n=1 Tax=Anopheles albimanus TaxID=7167 RepID=A0A182F885_ANOAL|nr:membrane-associated tyrosine- and threonine-specific cdc2-inhibitory kinase-like [Anopheles albimanus]